MMALVLTIVATFGAAMAMALTHFTIRIVRSNSAVYETNRMVTGGFRDAAAGQLRSVLNGATDYRVNHFIEPHLGEGDQLAWDRAGSLSDEAVDGVLARQH
jgi:hypothetical protein